MDPTPPSGGGGEDPLDLKEWDPSKLPDGAVCLMIGARHTGKTTLTRDIMYHMRKRLDFCIGMNPTEMCNHNLEFFIPRPFIFDDFRDDKLHHILEWQRRASANDKAFKVGFIMDDCMAETDAKGKKKNPMKSGDIDRLFKLGRHLNMFYINAMQYIKDAPPAVRGNTDYVFVFNTNSGPEKEKLWKEFFSMFTWKDFLAVFTECAVGYDCLVLDVRESRGKPGSGIYYYRAPLRKEPFRVGKSMWWRMCEYYFVNRIDYSMDPFKVLGVDVEAMAKKKDEAAGGGGGGGGLNKPRQPGDLIVRRVPNKNKEKGSPKKKK